jgi:hypothetical protein
MVSLQFVPLSSAPDVGFWRELGRRKLDELGLDDKPIPVWARVEPALAGHPSLVFVESASLGDLATCESEGANVLRGSLINTNTLEEFKGADKAGLIERAGSLLRDQLASSPPSSLSTLVVLTYVVLASTQEQNSDQIGKLNVFLHTAWWRTQGRAPTWRWPLGPLPGPLPGPLFCRRGGPRGHMEVAPCRTTALAVPALIDIMANNWPCAMGSNANRQTLPVAT